MGERKNLSRKISDLGVENIDLDKLDAKVKNMNEGKEVVEMDDLTNGQAQIVASHCANRNYGFIGPAQDDDHEGKYVVAITSKPENKLNYNLN